jgi:hypothetical protein
MIANEPVMMVSKDSMSLTEVSKFLMIIVYENAIVVN